MTFDEDRIRQSLQRNLEGMEVPRDVPPATMRRSRTRRLTWMVGTVALIVVALVGGIAGGMTLIRDDADTDLAPQPEETSGCVSVGYDLAVGVADGAKDEEISALEARLREDERVVKVWFVAAEDATRTYLTENPSHEGPIPSAHAVDQFRLVLVDDLKPHDERVLREFAEIGDGAYAPALRCPPKQPQQKFARYFFDVDEGNASASGTLEVDWEQRELCLEVETRNIKASHLLFRDPSAPDGRGQVVFTFLDSSSEDEAGPTLPPTGTHCFREAQLGELDDDLLAELVDTPQRFRIDFHRGPNDEPGLVALLKPEGAEDVCGSGPRIAPIRETAVPGHRVSFRGECFEDLEGDEDVVDIFLQAPLLSNGRVAQKHQADRQGTCDFIAKTRGVIRQTNGDEVTGSLTVPTSGSCRDGLTERLDVAIASGVYRLSIGCRACDHGSIQIRKAPGTRRFGSIDEAASYLSDKLGLVIEMPTRLPDGARLDPGREVVLSDDGRGRRGRINVRFGEKGILTFDFGLAGFDGCGGDDAVVVDINGTDGLMLAKDRYPWTQIIWPAHPGDRSATYGIYGSLPSDEMLGLARSMDLAMRGEGKPAGC